MPYTRSGTAYTPGQKLPIIGPWIGRVGRVYRIWSEPCNPSPWIMIEAAFISAPRLLWSLYGPDFIDYKYDQITKNFRTHGRRGKMKIWDVSYPAYDPPRGFGQVLFRGAEIAQKVGWYFIVIDATTEFVVNWSTLVYQLEGCHAPGILWCNLNGPEVLKVSIDGHSYTYGDFDVVGVSGLPWGPTGVGINAGLEFVASFTFVTEPVEIQPLGGTAATGTLWDNVNSAPLGVPTVSTDPVTGRTVSQSAFRYPVSAGLTHVIGVRVSPGVGWYKVVAATLSVSASHIKIDLDLNSGVKKITWPQFK